MGAWAEPVIEKMLRRGVVLLILGMMLAMSGQLNTSVKGSTDSELVVTSIEPETLSEWGAVIINWGSLSQRRRPM